MRRRLDITKTSLVAPISTHAQHREKVTLDKDTQQVTKNQLQQFLSKPIFPRSLRLIHRKIDTTLHL